MTTQMPKKNLYKLVFALCMTSILFVTVMSCTKSSSTNDAATFIGTWTGSTTCGSITTINTTVNFSAGAGANSLTFSGNLGFPGCTLPMTANGFAAANSFTFIDQAFTDNCGNPDTLSLVGNYNTNGTMTATFIQRNGPQNQICTFTGTLP